MHATCMELYTRAHDCQLEPRLNQPLGFVWCRSGPTGASWTSSRSRPSRPTSSRGSRGTSRMRRRSSSRSRSAARAKAPTENGHRRVVTVCLSFVVRVRVAGVETVLGLNVFYLVASTTVTPFSPAACKACPKPLDGVEMPFPVQEEHMDTHQVGCFQVMRSCHIQCAFNINQPIRF